MPPLPRAEDHYQNDKLDEPHSTTKEAVSFYDDQSPKKKKTFLSYECAVWVGYGIFTMLAIYDRFDWNIWPRQTFSIGSGSAGNDSFVGFKEGPWSVVFYDVLARASGRFSICCFNLLLIVRLRSLQHWIVTSFVGKYILDCSNIINANLRLHRWNGIALVVLTLLHVWSILLPCITHRWGAQVVVGTFEWPLSERAPPGFKDANAETHMMSLQVDDVFRMVEMTILLAILTPLSVYWLSTRRHIGIKIHQFVTVIYFVDIVRRHSHPHSWVLNTPVFVIWCLDKVWSNCWHRQKHAEVTRSKIGKDYMVLYWKHQFAIDTVGPDYFLRLNDSSFLESTHVFTSFGNHRNLQLEDAPNDDWDVGVVIRVFYNRRKPALSYKDTFSHTMRIYETQILDLSVAGPYHGEMSELVKNSLEGTRSVTLVAAGSGINYLIDALQKIMHKDTPSSCQVAILFCTRDTDLYDWAQRALSRLVEEGNADDEMVRVVVAYTGENRGKDGEHGMDVELPSSLLSCVSGRIDFCDEVLVDSVVYCQGSQGLKEAVATASHKNKSTFYGGLGGRG
jgi:predicted ferric reductase